MENNMKRFTFASLLVICTLSLAVFAQAGTISSGPINVPASMSINESLSLVVTGGPLVIPAINNGVSNVLTLTTTYNLIAANHAGGLQYATWFSSTNALTGNFTVASSALSTQVNGGSFLPCTGSAVQGSTAGATCSTWTKLTQTQLTATPSGTDSNTVAVQYTGTTLTNAGTASGTFNVLAYAL
jgi:hypothetical protein